MIKIIKKMLGIVSPSRPKEIIIRHCSICGAPMWDGYCIDNGAEYYCSAEHLSVVYTPDEYAELYKMGVAYWTEWESD